MLGSDWVCSLASGYRFLPSFLPYLLDLARSALSFGASCCVWLAGVFSGLPLSVHLNTRGTAADQMAHLWRSSWVARISLAGSSPASIARGVHPFAEPGPAPACYLDHRHLPDTPVDPALFCR